MTHQNLLGEPTPPPTYMPGNAEAAKALADGEDPADVAARFPAYSAAWADLAERALAGEPSGLGQQRGPSGSGQQGEPSRYAAPVAAYAYARTGYHRGLDQLRRSGWHGHGPVPWEHEPNRGFLRSLYLLSVAATAIGETDEAERTRQFLRDSSPAAADALGAK